MVNDLFAQFLKRMDKEEHVVRGLMAQVSRYEAWLGENQQNTLENSTEADLLAYLGSLEKQKKGLGKKNARGIALYFAMLGEKALASTASDYRESVIADERGGFNLKDMRGIDPHHLSALDKAGIRTSAALLEVSRTPADRKALAECTGIPKKSLLEMVKLADLSRIPGVKGIRARLYHDAGVDTLDKLATWEPTALRNMLVEWVERTGFEGIAALPKKVLYTVETARKLPRLIEY